MMDKYNSAVDVSNDLGGCDPFLFLSRVTNLSLYLTVTNNATGDALILVTITITPSITLFSHNCCCLQTGLINELSALGVSKPFYLKIT